MILPSGGIGLSLQCFIPTGRGLGQGGNVCTWVRATVWDGRQRTARPFAPNQADRLGRAIFRSSHAIQPFPHLFALQYGQISPCGPGQCRSWGPSLSRDELGFHANLTCEVSLGSHDRVLHQEDSPGFCGRI